MHRFSEEPSRWAQNPKYDFVADSVPNSIFLRYTVTLQEDPPAPQLPASVWSVLAVNQTCKDLCPDQPELKLELLTNKS